MSAIADTARFQVLLADYGAIDGVNKLNVLGAGIQIAGLDVSTGATAPQSVVVVVHVRLSSPASSILSN